MVPAHGTVYVQFSITGNIYTPVPDLLKKGIEQTATANIPI